MSATMSNENHQPTCQNCATSTTPLWRRDEIGSVLCNACGLFLKLHGRPRPISLKTDVIKSRNRVKSSGAGGQIMKKKNPYDGLEQTRSQAGTPPHGSLGQRRTSQKSANGHSEGSNSPISRTATPSMFNGHGLPTFNNHPYEDHYNHHSPSLPPMHIRHPSPGRSASPLNGVNGLEVPQTYEQLIAQCSNMKTRVSELEVINELFKSRNEELERLNQSHLREKEIAESRESAARQSERILAQRLEESQRRENQLKHRLDDVEREYGDLKGGDLKDGESKDGPPAAKKMRVADMVGDAELSTPASST